MDGVLLVTQEVANCVMVREELHVQRVDIIIRRGGYIQVLALSWV